MVRGRLLAVVISENAPSTAPALESLLSSKAGLFVVLQEIDMRRREGSGLTVARLHRLALVVAAKLLVSFAEGTAEARAH